MYNKELKKDFKIKKESVLKLKKRKCFKINIFSALRTSFK